MSVEMSASETPGTLLFHEFAVQLGWRFVVEAAAGEAVDSFAGQDDSREGVDVVAGDFLQCWLTDCQFLIVGVEACDGDCQAAVAHHFVQEPSALVS